MTRIFANKTRSLKLKQPTQLVLQYVLMALLNISIINMGFANVKNSNFDELKEVTDTSDKKELRDILKKIKNFSAEFEQQIVDGNGQLIQQAEGAITVAKPQKLRWEIIKPEPSLLIADSQTIFNVDPFVEQVTLIDQTDMTRSNPLMLLISDDPTQWNSVSVTKQYGTFIIVPTDLDASITQLNLEFNSENRLTGLSSIDRQQQKSTLKFTDLVTNQPIANDVFVFQVPANYVVDDQRAN